MHGSTESSIYIYIWRRASKAVEKCCVGGYARGGMRGPLGQIASSHSSGTSFVSNPQRCARFPRSANVSFRGPLKSQWALQAFEDTRLGMRGVCAAQGNGVPRKAVPAKRSGKACLCKMGMREGMRTIYICTFVHISARVCARVCASYIYVFSRKLTPKWLGMREGMRAIYM